MQRLRLSLWNWDTDHKKIGGILVEIILKIVSMLLEIIVLHTELGKSLFPTHLSPAKCNE